MVAGAASGGGGRTGSIARSTPGRLSRLTAAALRLLSGSTDGWGSAVSGVRRRSSARAAADQTTAWATNSFSVWPTSALS